MTDAFDDALDDELGWIDVRAAARYVGCSCDSIRENAERFGAGRIGTGKRARLRFRRDLIDAGLRGDAPAVEPPVEPEPTPVTTKRRASAKPRQRIANVELLQSKMPR